jgi:hypothetical protein
VSSIFPSGIVELSSISIRADSRAWSSWASESASVSPRGGKITSMSSSSEPA